jgi:PHP family Zn ribbon phosphoesterase
VPLEEIIGEALDVGRDSLTVRNQYLKLVKELGGEFNILLKVPIADIATQSDERIAYGVEQMRKGNINIAPGYDGVFGKISILLSETKSQSNKDNGQEQNQMKLF